MIVVHRVGDQPRALVPDLLLGLRPDAVGSVGIGRVPFRFDLNGVVQQVVQPTLLTNVRPGIKVIDEEIFGPVVLQRQTPNRHFFKFLKKGLTLPSVANSGLMPGGPGHVTGES